MKNPFELIREIEFNNLDRSDENLKTNLNNIQSFVLWLVGFTVGAIGLIISNIDKLKLQICFFDIQTALIFLIASLFFGIFNRYCLFRFQILSQVISNFVRISLSNFDFPETNPEELPKDITFSQLIERFKFDYDIDYERYIDAFELLDQVGKEKAFEELKDRHQKIGDFLRKTYEGGLENVRSVYKIAYGLSEKTSKKLFYRQHTTTAEKFNTWKYLVDFSFIFCCIFFIIAIFVLVIGFL